MPISPSRLGCLLAAAVAALVYISTLPAGFTFDDNFAVVRNPDVVSSHLNLKLLLHHDFWGQRLRSHQSHKSYRPLTVISFWLIKTIWQLLPEAWTSQVTSWRAELAESGNPTKDELPPAGMDPLPYHVANVLLHALASALVCRLAYHLFELRFALWQQHCGIRAQAHQQHSSASSASSSPTPTTKPKQPAPGQESQQQPVSHEYSKVAASAVVELMPVQGSVYQLIHVHLPAWVSGLWFALHPVHTEAVAGIVGHAELLCACLSIPALLLYFSAADSDVAACEPLYSELQATDQQDNSSSRQYTARLSAVQHWARVMAAVLLTWAAALSKEIGITFIGCMVSYDVLLVPLPPRDTIHANRNSNVAKGQAQSQHKGSSSSSPWQHVLRQRKWCRLVMLAAVLLLYVHARAVLAGDQLVRIYRKVENPIAFAPDRLTRVLSTGHLHTRYAWLLVWPQHLSADWSHACVPLIHSLTDVRNIPSVVLYVYMAVIIARAKPWTVLLSWLRLAQQHSWHGHQMRSLAMWRLFVMVGLILGPFLPASNVLFYVGTFIGERLLYCPSVGAVLLAAEALFPGVLHRLVTVIQLSRPILSVQSYQQRQVKPTAKKDYSAPGSHWPHLAAQAGIALLGLAVTGSVALAAGRTWSRNWEWFSEETLFVAAQKVCGSSAKVALNNGILARRHLAFDAALQHFYTARSIEPTYCEPAYWIGTTLINQGDVQGGLLELEAALHCKWVAADALNSLHAVYQALQQASPHDSSAWLIRWGTLLVQPHVARVTEGCEALEAAAMSLMLPVLHLPLQQHPPQAAPHIAAAAQALKSCEAAVARQAEVGEVCVSSQAPGRGDKAMQCSAVDDRPHDANEEVPLMMGSLARHFLGCIRGRAAVYTALLQHSLASPAARLAMYRYLSHVRTATPGCRLSGGTWTVAGVQVAAPGRDIIPGALSSNGTDVHSVAHMQLVHRFQSVDADDPWLQQEWGEVLYMMPGRVRDAVLHTAAAGMLFSTWAHSLTQGVAQQHKLVSLTGDPISTLACVSAAADAYARAVSMAQAMGLTQGTITAFAGHATLCDLMHRAVDARMAASQWAQGDAAGDELMMLKRVWRGFRDHVAELGGVESDSDAHSQELGACRASLNEINQKLGALGLREVMMPT